VGGCFFKAGLPAGAVGEEQITVETRHNSRCSKLKTIEQGVEVGHRYACGGHYRYRQVEIQHRLADARTTVPLPVFTTEDTGIPVVSHYGARWSKLESIAAAALDLLRGGKAGRHELVPVREHAPKYVTNRGLSSTRRSRHV
jgi:hypothetical protein